MKQHHSIALAGLIILIIVIVGLVVMLRQPAAAPATAPASSTSQTSSQQNTNTPTQLQKIDETVGTGAEAVPGKQVTVNYTGTLANGQVFDSSYSRNQPFSFTLGAGQVIKGWDEGVVGMKVGGKRKLIIPPSLGYGSQAVGSIPPYSTLTFQIQLLSVN